MNLTSLLEFLGLQPSLKSANGMDGQARSTDGSTFDALLAWEAGPDAMEPVSAPVNDALRAPVQGNLPALMHPGQTAALPFDQADIRLGGIDLPALESTPGKALPLIEPIPVDQDQSHRAVAEVGLEPDLVMADPRASQQTVESHKADIPVSGAPGTIQGQNAYNLPVGESAPPAGSAKEPSLGLGDRPRTDPDSGPMRARVASSDRWSETRRPLSSATPRQGPIGDADADSELTPLAAREPSYRSPDGVPVPPAGMGTRRNTLGRPSAMPAETPAVAEHADDIALEARPKRSAVDGILQTQQQRAAAPRVAQGPALPGDAEAYAKAYAKAYAQSHQGRAAMEPAIGGVVSEMTAEPHKGTVDATRAASTPSVESAPPAVSARAVAEAVPANRSESVAEIRSGSVVQLPEMARDNVDSIANRLAQRVSMLHATRGHQATVMLEPLDLGRIEVKVRMQADTTHLSFAVQHAPVRDVVETHMARLRTMLEDAGLNLGDVDVGDLAQGHPESEARYAAPSVPGFESDADTTGSEGEVSSTAPVASDSLIDVHA